MEANEYLFDRIEAYLNGKLTKQEVAAFEKEMATDTALQELVKLHRFEQKALNYMVAKDLKAKLNEWDNNTPARNQTEQIPTKYYKWKWGLGLLLISLVMLIIWYQKTALQDENAIEKTIETPAEPSQTGPDATNPKDERKEPIQNVPMAEIDKTQIETKLKKDKELFGENQYELLAMNVFADELNTNKAVATRKVEQMTSDNALAFGLKAFIENDMNVAVSEFRQIDPTQFPDEYEQAQEYIGQAYLFLHQYGKASSIFESMTGNPSNTMVDRAEWYLLLSLLPEYPKHKTKVDALLEKMTKPSNYHNKAKSAALIKERLSKLQ